MHKMARYGGNNVMRERVCFNSRVGYIELLDTLQIIKYVKKGYTE